MRLSLYGFGLSVSYKWEGGMIMRIVLYARVSALSSIGPFGRSSTCTIPSLFGMPCR